MSTPRVLQVVLNLNPGGTERLVIELVTRLNADIPMMVCCLDAPGGWAHELEEHGVPVTALGRGRGFRPSLGQGIAEAVRRHRATVIHAHQYSPFVYSCLARFWRPAVRVIFTEHGRLSDAAASAKRRNANRMLRRFPRRVFAVSGDLKRHLVEEGFGPEAVDVIHNGIDVGPPPNPTARAHGRQLLAVSNDELVIGTIARLDPIKDIGTLILATSQMPLDRPVVLAILGDGAERNNLEKLATELGVSSRIRFLGHRDDAREWVAGCDVYVNSSINEGVSLTILEAMAAGLPVIATRVGGTPEVIDDACGRLVPPRDPAALRKALMEMTADQALRRALGVAGRKRVETRFSLDRMVREYRDVYLGVA